MTQEILRPPGTEPVDEELIDALITVSVIAKRLAEKLRNQQDSRKAVCRPCTRIRSQYGGK